MKNPVVIFVTSRLHKLAIHAAAMGAGVAVAVLGNGVVDLATESLDPMYAGAIGLAVGDFMRQVFLEIRKVDPDFTDPVTNRPARPA